MSAFISVCAFACANKVYEFDWMAIFGLLLMNQCTLLSYEELRCYVGFFEIFYEPHTLYRYEMLLVLVIQSLRISRYETKYSIIDQVKLWNTAYNKFEVNFKGCIPQILLGPFLNNLSHMLVRLK